MVAGQHGKVYLNAVLLAVEESEHVIGLVTTQHQLMAATIA